MSAFPHPAEAAYRAFEAELERLYNRVGADLTENEMVGDMLDALRDHVYVPMERGLKLMDLEARERETA
jgi:hypothetical protein